MFKFILFLFGIFITGLKDAEAQHNFYFPLTSAVQTPELILSGTTTITDSWLRLVPNENNQYGVAYIDKAFSPYLGLLAEFEYKIWSDQTSVADGISVFLYDGAISRADFRSGETGGCLAYSRNTTSSNDKGLKDAYLGIALDEYGTFSGPGGGPGGGNNTANAIAIRAGATRNYSYIAGTTERLGNAVDPVLRNQMIAYTTPTSTRPTDNEFYRKVRFYIVPNSLTNRNANFAITVQLQIDEDGPFRTVIKDQPINEKPPDLLKIGFGASTGGSRANHEVRYLRVTTPMDLQVQNAVSPTVARVGEKVRYKTTLSNIGINAVTGTQVATLRLKTDGVTLANDITLDMINPHGVSITKNTNLSTPLEQVYDITQFPINTSLTLTYEGTITLNTNFLGSNTATITLPTGFWDLQEANNIGTATAIILKNIDLLIKHEVDLTTAIANTKINYTTSIKNSGNYAITGPHAAILSIETQGLHITTDLLQGVQLNDPNIQITKDRVLSTPKKEVYTIKNFPANGTITLTYQGNLVANNRHRSAINRVKIDYPINNFYDTDQKNNIQIVQTFIKPVLTLPKTLQICAGSTIDELIKSDNPTITTYSWTTTTSKLALQAYPATGRTNKIHSQIDNEENVGGTVTYEIRSQIEASIVDVNGTTDANQVTQGDVLRWVVTIKARATADTSPVNISNDAVIKYTEPAVFTPHSNLVNPIYTWYETADKTRPINNNTNHNIDEQGILTQHKLLPGNHTFYVTVYNADFCEAETFPAHIKVKPIPIEQPANMFTPEHEHTWKIKNIEQYHKCKIWIYDRRGTLVYIAKKGYTQPWDGTYKKQPLPGHATYYYFINLQDGIGLDKKNTVLNGYVAILR